MEDARTRISLLTAWCRGAAVAAVASLALAVTGPFGMVAPSAGFAAAICVLGGAETARRCFLRKCAPCAEFGEITAVARYRRRLCSARSRRRLAGALRRTARDSPAARANPYLLWSRVALVRDELTALADELESASAGDPRAVIEIKTLLCDGRDSPLLNDQPPPELLLSTVRCARFRVITVPVKDSTGPSAIASGPRSRRDSPIGRRGCSGDETAAGGSAGRDG
jgi:hypothetical protein